MGFWNKLFYGASKRFANDAANIAANETRKNINQHAKKSANVDEGDSENQQRAVYLNQLRHILLKNKELLAIINDVLAGMSRLDISPIELEKKVEYQGLILDAGDIVWQKYDEADKINEIGDHLSETTNDYAVYYKSQNVRLINAEIVDLLSPIRNFLFEDDLSQGDDLQMELEKLINKSKKIEEKIDTLYEEITRMNIVIIGDSRGKHTIDYNR